jgi:hypothetical protein
MFRKTENNEQLFRYEQPKVSEEVQITLRKLQMLKSKISELREQCEELKKLSSHTHVQRSEARDTSMQQCSKCGRAIELGQEIVVKDPDGMETGRYHRECFKLFWV